MIPRELHRWLVLSSLFLAVCSGVSPDAHAGQVDVTVFLGRAFPIYDERLSIPVPAPSLPGVQIDVAGDPVIRADGGSVVGGALGFELGVIAIEARVDSTRVGFDLSGARYDLRATQPPFAGLTGSLTIGDGRFDARRSHLLSGNVRLRTPGPVGLVVSGGLSLLPDVTITGSVPIVAEIAGLPALPGFEPRLRLQAAPGESGHRVGVNGGAGLRLGANRLALMFDVRGFYFREYDLRLDLDDAPDVAATLLESADTIRFRPVIVNAQAGLVFRF